LGKILPKQAKAENVIKQQSEKSRSGYQSSFAGGLILQARYAA
jgi:hypothetical protein